MGRTLAALGETKETTMAVAVYVHPKAMTMKQYEEVHRRLTEAGQGDPPARLHHSCFGPDGMLMVYDVWESAESFQAFAGALLPVLAEVGVDPGQPMVMPVVRMSQSSVTQPT
jgi:hypothetical protein